MDTTFNEDPFFTTVLQNGEQGLFNNLLASKNDNVVLQITHLPVEKSMHSKETARDTSFALDEDNLLVLAWLNISVEDQVNEITVEDQEHDLAETQAN